MAKLFLNKKCILNNMIFVEKILSKARGLMFSDFKKVNNGICIKINSKKDLKFGSSVTMFFCFYSLDILFVNSNFEVVDKVTLKPFKLNYTPKKPCKFIIESFKNNFKKINIGDKIRIEN